MDSNIDKAVKNLKKGPSLAKPILDRILGKIDFTLPDDYIDFITHYNGAEGVIGNSYLQLLRAEELQKENEGYQVEKYAPGHFIFGSDLGGTAYAFNKSTLIVIAFDLVGMLVADDPLQMGENLTVFLNKLAESY